MVLYSYTPIKKQIGRQNRYSSKIQMDNVNIFYTNCYIIDSIIRMRAIP